MTLSWFCAACSIILLSSNVVAAEQRSFTLVHSIKELASDIAANPSGAYALANDYDASQDGTYASAPIPTVFTGTFDGRGHTISNLSISDPTPNDTVGLFAQIGTSAKIRNLALANEAVTGTSGPSLSSSELIGGLVGFNVGGSISHVSVAGSVSGGNYAAVGGLAGISEGPIEACEAHSTVSYGAQGDAGGLVGGTAPGGTIKDSSATGNVTGSAFTGGLVGYDYGTAIINSNASGKVAGDAASARLYNFIGGLVGLDASGAITRSFATGAVSCRYACGGLVGVIEVNPPGNPLISRSYAGGSVTGEESAGGLVGQNLYGSIVDTFATGAVKAKTSGGLIGQNDNGNGYHSILRSYSVGTVSGASGSTGGLIGYDENASTTGHAYWDTTTSDIKDRAQGAGNVSNDPGIKGLSTAELQEGLPKGFGPKIWGENANINGGLPYLLALPPSQ